MKRFIAILSLTIILIGISVFEEIYIHHFISIFNEKASVVSNIIEINKENLNQENIKIQFDDLNSYWEHSKTKICYFTNYDKIKSMDESFIKLESAIKNNDDSLAIENIAIIENYSQFLHYTMGFTLNNLF